MMPTRQPIRKSAVIGRGFGNADSGEKIVRRWPARADRDAQVGGAIPRDILKFLPLRELSRQLRRFEKSARDQGVLERKDDNSIRDSALLGSHLRAREERSCCGLLASLRSVLCVGNRDTEALPKPDELSVQLLRADIRIAIRKEGIEKVSGVVITRSVLKAAA